MPPRFDTLASHYAGQLAPAELAGLVARVRAEAARLRTVNEHPDPLALALHHDHHTVATPALRLLSRQLVDTVNTRDGRLVVAIGPQQGKTNMLRWLCAWLLADDPGRRITYVSYGHELARESGRFVRSLITTHGDDLGLSVARDQSDASNWSLHGQPGGMYCTGTGGSLTGRPSDVMVVDDALKGEADADSEVIRRRLHTWWESTARTRLAPGAPVIVVGTRWHEQDLSGRLLEEGWPLLNIPALADGKVPDALDRPLGEWLESARGTTVADWEKLRAESGERAFYALMQGAPSPPEGGIFRREWFDQHRVHTAPALEEIVVGVDPAETGTGDAAGILVTGRAADHHLYLLGDLSGQLSQAQWGRRVCLAYLTWGAARVIQEQNLGMASTIPDAWAMLRRQATALRAAQGDVLAACAALLAAGNDTAADEPQLHELVPHVDAVLGHVSTGPRVVSIPPRQKKRVRAQAVTGLFETGRAHVVGRLPELEYECVTWQEGQASPNRIDVMAMVLAQLDTARQESKVSRPRQRVATRTHSPPSAPASPRAPARR